MRVEGAATSTHAFSKFWDIAGEPTLCTQPAQNFRGNAMECRARTDDPAIGIDRPAHDASIITCSMFEHDALMQAHGDAEAAQLAVLRLLQRRPEMSQRELSEALGLSLGKTHYVLHSLLDLGLVKAGNFRHSGNKLAYAYVLTPSGLRERLRLTRAFLKRKEAEYEQLRRTIASLKGELVESNR
jgi:EPS-associated MarR family transcriptional regulator